MRTLRRARFRFPRAAALSAVLLLPAASFAAHVRRVERLITPQSGKGGVEVMAEEALVRFDETTDAQVRNQALAAAGMESVGPVGTGPWHMVYLPAGMPTASGLAVLRALPGVADAEPNHAFRPLKTPNDPKVGEQYHFGSINAYTAWEYETGGSNPVIIAVMDTGIDGAHPDLTGKLAAGESRDCSTGVCAAGGEPAVACNHGTRVAGAAAASSNNGAGIAGVSWGAQLASVRVFPTQAQGGCSTNDCGGAGCVASDDAIVRALQYVTDVLRPANAGRKVVINMSLGAQGVCPSNTLPAPNDKPVQQEINDAVAAGIVVVAATGNDGASTVDNPANCVGVIPVGSTDSDGSPSSFSNRGTELANNGLVAPGRNVITTDVNGGYASATGTSFASPIVAGAAALILANKPAFTPAQVKDTLRGSAANTGVSAASLEEGVHPLGNTTGAGLLNLFLAMRLAITGTIVFDGTNKAIAAPNPFKPSANGRVLLTVPANLQGRGGSVKIYTLAGQLVKTINGATGGASWDGKNEDGNPVATGTYVFYVSTDKGSTSGRLALIR